MSRIVVAGHLCVDLSPHSDRLSVEPGRLIEIGPLSVALGGSVANTGRTLTALGHTVSIATHVGDDDLGRIAADHFAILPGIVGSPQVVVGGTTSYSIVIEPSGADRSFWHHVGTNADFDGTEVDVAGAYIVHLGYPSLLPQLVEDGGAALIRFLERAHRHGATTSVDLAVIDPMTKSGKLDWQRILRNTMPSIDVISPSVDDLRTALHEPNATAPTMVELLLDWGAGVVAVSDGKNGVFVGAADAERVARGGLALAPLTQTWAGARINQPSVQVRRVATTNGAGDAATAGLISAIVTGEVPAAAALRSATTAAAIIQGDRPTAVV